jgi:hypothetical protein
MAMMLLQTLSGFADGGYASDTHGRLRLVQAQWSRETSATQPLGFTVALVAGDDGDAVHAAEPEAFRHVYQASVAWRLPSGVVVEGGIYPSHIGFESFYAKDDWNYTRGLLAEMSPYYQAGVKASYAFDAHWSGQVHVLNGWQLIDGDVGRAVGTQVAYASDTLSASLNTYVDADRKFADAVVLWRAHPRWQLAASTDVGNQDVQGVALFARFDVDKRNAIAARVETDRDLREATVTWQFRPHTHLLFEFETRYDTEPERFFAVAGAVVTF